MSSSAPQLATTEQHCCFCGQGPGHRGCCLVEGYSEADPDTTLWFHPLCAREAATAG